VLFLLYSNSGKITEDQVADITSDVTHDEKRDTECVTEDYLSGNYVLKEVLKIDIDRISKLESRLLDIESVGENSYAIGADLEYRIEGLEDRIFTQKEKDEMLKVYSPSAESIEKLRLYNESIRKHNAKNNGVR